MRATTHRHGDLIPGTEEVVHELRGGVDDDGGALAIGEGVAGALVDDEGAGGQGGGDGVRVVGQVLGVVDEGAEGGVAPPRRALLRVLERLVLPAEPVVPVRPHPLHARAHGHRQRDALVQQPRGERALAEPRTPRHAHAVRVDLGHRCVQRVQSAVEAPGPGC